MISVIAGCYVACCLAIVASVYLDMVVRIRRRIKNAMVGSQRWCDTCKSWVNLGRGSDEARLDAWARHEHDHSVGDKLLAAIEEHPDLRELAHDVEYWYDGQL
jgi:hypothetical protein